ncbi:MAG TPA: ATP-binding protein, partial [Kineosporiaceae bacterium]|nr:ATP-binding protein [Kineosporiaceae bacterium]
LARRVDWLGRRAADAPGNYAHLDAWARAEQAWSGDDRWAAALAFDSALGRCRATSRTWQTGLITERAARFHLQQGLESAGRSLLEEAHDAYAQWGAVGKVHLLEREFPFLQGRVPGGGPPATGETFSHHSSGVSLVTGQDALDLLGVLKASQALSSRMSLDQLRRTVVSVLTEMTGATGIQLALRQDSSSGWFVFRPQDRERAGAAAGTGTAVDIDQAGDLLPLSVFRYAERTGEPLLVHDAAHDERFTDDPYLAGLQRCSMLVVPVLTNGVRRAMLVLENRLYQGAFSANRLEAVRLTAGQLAISLENAMAERFRSLVQHSADVTLVCDRSAAITYASSSAAELFGVAGKALRGAGLGAFLPADDQAVLLGRIQGVPAGDGGLLECRISPVGGPQRWAQVSITDLTADPAVGGVVLRLRDVTDLHRLENELRHAQKLESVGQLASGIAHEINTPIQFVGDNLRFLIDACAQLTEVTRTAAAGSAVPAGTDLEDLCEEIPQALQDSMAGVTRVATIVRAMKAFGHPGRQGKSYADLNEAVRNTLVVATSEIKAVAEVRLELDPDLPQVWCDISDINQVLLNLVINAAHAMRDQQAATGARGTLTVRTRVERGGVLVQVQDTGTGIPPEIADRVFDQFFTTKEVGEGTGQGLALAHTLVHDRHGGTITFDSVPGAGTTFSVRLPDSSAT